jgi:DNA mismatch repair protein MutS2
MNRYTGSEDYRRMLQSPQPSQRDGRWVLAVKANFRGRLRGIVHETSATGQTVYIEPEEVVERNNDVLLEERRLEMEIRKVLKELTAELALHYEPLTEYHRRMLWVESRRARARYTREHRGVFAEEGLRIALVQARHPLLGSKAVPIDIALGEATREVIITGPNTGGKTVALNTVGLLAVMNQWGLGLPGANGTQLPIYDSLFADIGDEQSLSQSLSTFSAHMKNMAGIVAGAGGRSLALLDELGSGTDPQEGSAIAMAILDALGAAGSTVIATTHHGALKHYGYTRPGVENASVDFDSETLSPTYRIIMGLPGESRALDIAARNGLPGELVAAARGYLDEERSDMSALIRELERRRRDLDDAAREAEAEERRLREDRRKADLRELRLRQEALVLKQGAAGRLGTLLTDSRKGLENLVREIREGELTRDKTLKVKSFLQDLAATVSAEKEALAAEEKALASERRAVEGAAANSNGRKNASSGVEPGSPNSVQDVLSLEPGAEALIIDTGRRCTILRQGKRGFFQVQAGSVKMTVAADNLTPVAAPAAAKKPLVQVSTEILSAGGGEGPALELKLLGMRLIEALQALQRQIDAAVLAGMAEFAVIHGMGEGVLQQGVQNALRHNSAVAEFHYSRPEQGGFGRTEVVLKR